MGSNYGSAYFDGSGDYLYLNNNTTVSGPFTLEFWTYFTEYTASGASIRFFASHGTAGGNAADNMQLFIGTVTSGDQKLGAVLGYTNAYFINGAYNGPAINDAAWHHVALTRDSSNEIRFFIDGTKVNSSTTLSTAFKFIGTNIGTRDRAIASDNFTGYISDFLLSETTAKYTADFTPPTSPVGNTNATAYLPMDNAGVFDKSGHTNLELYGNAATSSTQQKFSNINSIYFDGNYSSSVYSANPLVPAGGSYTVEFWVYSTTTGTSGTGFIWQGSQDYAYGIYTHNTSNTMSIHTYGGGGGGNTIYFEIPLTYSSIQNQWKHMAHVWDGTSHKFFIDGVSQTVTDGTGASSATSNPHPLQTGQGPVYIGKIWNSNYIFTGYLSDIQILNTAKYTAGFTPHTASFGRGPQGSGTGYA